MDKLDKMIKSALAEKGWTVKYLCQKIGISEQGYQYSIKNNSMKMETMFSIAKLLKKPISYFFDSNLEDEKIADEYSMRLLHGVSNRYNEQIIELKADLKRVLTEAIHYYIFSERMRNWKNSKTLQKKFDYDEYAMSSFDQNDPELPKKIAEAIYEYHYQEFFKKCEWIEKDGVYFFKLGEILKELNALTLVNQHASDPSYLKKKVENMKKMKD